MAPISIRIGLTSATVCKRSQDASSTLEEQIASENGLLSREIPSEAA